MPNVDSLILSTINAPYRKKLDVQAVVRCLQDPSIKMFFSGPMASFFSDVNPDLKKQFASVHGLDEATMAAAVAAFETWSGRTAA